MDENLMIIVTVDDQHLNQIQSISNQLQTRGMQVDAVMPTVGVISGVVNANGIAALNQVEGVASVEIQQEYTAT